MTRNRSNRYLETIPVKYSMESGKRCFLNDIPANYLKFYSPIGN